MVRSELEAQTPTGAALLASPVRRAIVDHLEHHRVESPADRTRPPGLTAAELAGVLELHVTTVRFHVDQLVAAGILQAEFSRSFGVGRPRKVYSVAPGSFGGSGDEHGLKLLTGLLAEAFGDGGSPAEAGEAWARRHVPTSDAPAASTPGEWLGKVGQVIDVLHEWGYRPDLTTTDQGRTARVDLHNCPFLDLAQTHPAVVCGVHRGLIRGALNQLGEPEAHVSLEPFVEPLLCQAHITTTVPFRNTNPEV